jgi:hypothetical protein
VLGFSFVGLQVVAIPTIAITYAIDCYEPVTGEIMVIATVVKNTFGVSFAALRRFQGRFSQILEANQSSNA